MQIVVKPAKGLAVKKPDGSKLAAEGETVTRTSFWLRRLQDGDVTEVKPVAKVTKQKPSEE
ncbi:DUF2635 domain-containing protein [Aeromonas allosaccharophila]